MDDEDRRRTASAMDQFPRPAASQEALVCPKCSVEPVVPACVIDRIFRFRRDQRKRNRIGHEAARGSCE